MDRLRDLLIGSVLLTASLASAGVSYSAIAAQERPKESWVSSYLVEGAQDYALRSNTTCIGNFSVTLDPQQSPSLNLKGTVRASFNGMESSPQLVGTVTLNPLRQVSAAEFKVTGGNARISVIATDVNPVKVALDGVAGAKTFSRTFSVPGPITFTRLSNGHFTVEGPALRAGNNPLAAHITQLLLQDIKLSTETVADSSTPCTGADSGAADITPMVQRIEALVPDWMKKAISEQENIQGIL